MTVDHEELSDLLDDDEPTAAEAWATFSSFFNASEFLDLLAASAVESEHAHKAYALIEEAADGEIVPLKARMLILSGRS